jgi:hypothetical protein
MLAESPAPGTTALLVVLAGRLALDRDLQVASTSIETNLPLIQNQPI